MTREELLKIAKPIFFNTQMVIATLDGRKGVTRRVVKPQPDEKHNFPLGFVSDSTDKKDIGKFGFGIDEYGGSVQYAKPPCKKGDYLYVRETWTNWGCSECEDYECENCIAPVAYLYKADGEDRGVKWKPSIHMPKEAARIFLKVTDVRVERLQDITISEMEKEGLIDECKDCTRGIDCDVCIHEDGIIDEWQHLWNSTIKKQDLDTYGWNANPWVWVVEFERVEVKA